MKKRFACLHFVREIRNSLGGVVSTVVDLCQSMSARGHQITLITCDGRDAPAHWTNAAGQWPRVLEVSHSRLTRLLLNRAALDRCRDLAGEIDVAHLHTPWELGNYQLSSLLRRQGVPYVITVHGMLDHYTMAQKALKKRAFLALGGRRLFRRATTVHFTAQSEMDQALNYVPGVDRSYVESCALDLTPYRDLPGIEPAHRAFPQIERAVPTLLFLSRVHPKKRVESLLHAAAILQQTGRRYQVLIAGPGDPQYVSHLKSLAAELGIGKSTLFLGMVQGIEKRSLYQLADAFVLPTHQENFGLVLPEAMACGVPVITTRGTDIWRELQSGGATIVDGSPQSIADAVIAVTGDPEKRRALGQQGQEFVHRWLDADRVAASYENMYFDAIRRGIPPFDGKPATLKGEVLAAR